MNVMCCWVKAVRERLREWRSAVLAEMGSEGMLVGMLRRVHGVKRGGLVDVDSCGVV